MSFEERRQFEFHLWSITRGLSGKMDADEFKDYIFGFIFYKYLSDKMLKEANEILKLDNLTYDKLIGHVLYDEFINNIKKSLTVVCFLKPEELFSEVLKKGKSSSSSSSSNASSDNFILDDLNKVFDSINSNITGSSLQINSVHFFEDLNLESIKLGKELSSRNETIVAIMEQINKVNFELINYNADILGDAYEYLIRQFSSGAGKKAGEYYTPQEVATILSKIVTSNKKELDDVYDPTCGSGSLLLRISKEAKVNNYYGQELNRTTYNLARMNMIMHNINYSNFDIKQDDTLQFPHHINLKFDAIVANPPFSATWSANSTLLNDPRFAPYGKLAPHGRADYAFIQHMLYHLKDDGIMAVVLPHGVLFRKSNEGHIRKILIDDFNYLDAVIGLPGNIFYGTGIETCILVFKKFKSDDILFINASKEFVKGKNYNYLTEANIDKIVNTYLLRKTINKFSYLASLEEVKENNFNLSIPMYINTMDEPEIIDLDLLAEDIEKNKESMNRINSKIAKFCEELGIKKPF